jgi:hypothetical protein
MSGLKIPFTGTNSNLCIHFLPGARGDFLASVLVDDFKKRANGALHQPDYLKIHHNFNQTSIDNNYIVIRIDDNKSIDSIMQITVNGFLKNPVAMLNDTIDHYYTRIKDTHYTYKETVDSTRYNYWIDFASLSDIKFLQDIYYHFHCRPMRDGLIHLIEENIKQQISWKTIAGLEKLSWLIDFEIKFNLLHWNKTFSIQEYMATDDSRSWLTIKNYSKEPFVL